MVIVDLGDLPAALEVVVSLASDNQRRAQLRRRALEFYDRYLSWDTIGRQFLDVASAVVENGRAATP